MNYHGAYPHGSTKFQAPKFEIKYICPFEIGISYDVPFALCNMG
jgi:hypothetical protein